MIISPIQNTAIFNLKWLQNRARNKISQKFGNKLILNEKDVYKIWGLKGHNGIDYAVPIGTPIFAPISGWIRIKNDRKDGYGLHVKIRSKERRIEICLAHLSKIYPKNGFYITQGDVIAHSGNTGFSTAPHLHFGLRKIKYSYGKDVFSWPVENYENGYKGYVNQELYTIEWKGNHVNNNL